MQDYNKYSQKSSLMYTQKINLSRFLSNWKNGIQNQLHYGSGLKYQEVLIVPES